jgi:hypothetical protein
VLLQAAVPSCPAYARSVVARVLLMSSTRQQQSDGVSGTYLCCTVEGGVAPDTVVLPDISTCIREAQGQQALESVSCKFIIRFKVESTVVTFPC